MRDWPNVRLRFVVDLNPSKSEVTNLARHTLVSFLPMEAIGERGSLDLSREREIGDVESGFTYFRNGDVVLAKITPCFENGKGALVDGLTNGIGFGTTELIVLRPRDRKVSSRFLYWLSYDPSFRKQGEATMYGAGGQKRVPDDFVRDYRAQIPPFDEQLTIAAFLDRETTKIDALVAEQQRLIGLLTEKRQALISRSVTRGLNPSVPMKDSGTDWLGEVPAHWEPVRIKHLFRKAKRQGHDDRVVLSVYRDFGVIEKDSRNDNINKTPEDLSSYQLVEPGDLVINKMKAWQGSLGISMLTGITSPDYVVFTPTHNEAHLYIHYLLRHDSMRNLYKSISNGIRPEQWRIETELFQDLVVFLPPRTEQQEIVNFITDSLSKLESLTNEAERVISVLQERRSALISAAVTGQIDVRERVRAEVT